MTACFNYTPPPPPNQPLYSIALKFELTLPPRFPHYMQEAEISHYSELVTATFS